MRLFFRLCIAFLLVPDQSFAQADLNMPAEERIQIRSRILNPEIMFTDHKQRDDSVGIPFSSNHPDEFRLSLSMAISMFGEERFRGGTFFILGSNMGNSDTLTQRQYEKVARELGLADLSIKFKVLSVPDNLILKKSVSLLHDVWQRAHYILPSMTRDFQKPQSGEVINGLVSTALLEIPTVLFLAHSMDGPVALMTATVHFATLAAYSVYSKSMLNWLLRSSSKSDKIKAIESFFKQMSLSLPFVVNYNVFSQSDRIVDYVVKNGFVEAMQVFPEQLGIFVSTHGLTLVVQTLFYNILIRNMGGWLNSIDGEEKSRNARSVRPWLETPFKMVDSVILAMASSNWGTPLVTYAGAEFNWGHVSLLALTAFSWQILHPRKVIERQSDGDLAADVYPSWLYKSIPLYLAINDGSNRLRIKMDTATASVRAHCHRVLFKTKPPQK